MCILEIKIECNCKDDEEAVFDINSFIYFKKGIIIMIFRNTIRLLLANFSNVWKVLFCFFGILVRHVKAHVGQPMDFHFLVYGTCYDVAGSK